MIGIETTDEFEGWLTALRDADAKHRILIRVRRLAMGNPGKCRSLQGGLFEMKVDWGPGYRVYYTWRGAALVLLLCGGDKRTQRRDIDRARTMAAQLD